jgi:hypothetical protein
MQLLPSELKHLIAELLAIVSSASTTRSSLAAMARTHPSYQREAERALYNTLLIHAYADKYLKCMEILARNQEKAALVRSLTIEYARCTGSGNIDKNRKVTTYLSKSLINMHTLSDLRIRVLPDGEGMSLELEKILWSV